MKTFLVFDSAQEARDYRHTQGTGGWIFEDEATGEATIFPPEMTPTAILRHPMTKGKTGNLIGHVFIGASEEALRRAFKALTG